MSFSTSYDHLGGKQYEFREREDLGDVKFGIAFAKLVCLIASLILHWPCAFQTEEKILLSEVH
jgi:hypothetical protein